MSIVTSVAAAILSASFLFFSRLIANEGGFYEQILSYQLGYYLWMSGSVVMAIGNITVYYLERHILEVKVINRS